MQRLFLLLTLLYANTATLAAQNLVQNPDFKVNTGGYLPLNQPTDRAKFEQRVSNWLSANGTSPDIVNTNDVKKNRRQKHYFATFG